MGEKEQQKKVLVLGAGFVSSPVVEYLTRDENVYVTVAARFTSDSNSLSERFPRVSLVKLDVCSPDSEEQLSDIVSRHALCVSLLPYAFHVRVAELCIRHRVDMVTASYRSPAMLELDQRFEKLAIPDCEAKEAGITIMNEVGVDPGIDHMLAMECFDEIKAKGGKVRDQSNITSFISWCGGLPAPEFSDNPLRYKFSWSPKGVLLTLLNGAKYLQDNKVVEIQGNGGLLESAKSLDFLPGFNLEGYPNRDSTLYADIYGIKDAHTIIRGTLRYRGFSQAGIGLLKLGLIDLSQNALLQKDSGDITWRQVVCSLVGVVSTVSQNELKKLVLNKVEELSRLNCIEELGLLNDIIVDRRETLLDSLSVHLAIELAYDSDERDLIVMRHDVGVEWPDKSSEVRHIDLIAYGNSYNGGYSAMTATVGFPAGIAAKMLLDGEITAKGTVLPFKPEIYQPMLKLLAKEGIKARERITKYNANGRKLRN